MIRAEFDLGSSKGVEVTQSANKLAAMLGRPFTDIIRTFVNLPSSTLDAICGKRGPVNNVVDFPRYPSDPDSLPPVA